MRSGDLRSRRRASSWAGGILALAFAGCSVEPPLGPGTIHWDRDTCEHCMMAIGDPHYAAQIRDAKGVLHRFDDFGCAVVWLDTQRDSDPPLGWWVGSRANGWLDATTAGFVDGEKSPMGYGFRAVENGEAGLGLDEVRARIREREDARRNSRRREN